MNRTFVVGSILAVAVAAIIAVVSQNQKKAPSTPLTAVQQPVSLPEVYGLGTVEAKIISRLGFELPGTLHVLTVDQGDVVRKGDVLAALDMRDQMARVAQAEAGIRQAQAALSQSLARLERAKAVRDQRRSVNDRRQTLVHHGTISQEAAEDARAGSQTAAADVAVAMADVDAARGGIEAATAKLTLEQAILAKASLTAPYDGVVIERSREIGSILTAGQPVLTVADPSSVWVTAFVDETLAGRVKVGQAAQIQLRSHLGMWLHGVVARIDLENDRVSEERRVQIMFEHGLRLFTLGEQAEVLIQAPPLPPSDRTSTP